MLETLEELDEALAHSLARPVDQRDEMWQAWVDSLLDKRNRLARTDAQARETRVVFSGESR